MERVMTESNKKLLIKLQPKNDPTQLTEMLMEFEALGLKLDGGVISVPKNYTIVNEEKELIFVFPDRLDFVVALEEDEYLIIAEQ